MRWHWSDGAAAMLAAAVVCAGLGAYVWRRRGNPARQGLLLILLASCAWSVAYMAELAAGVPEWRRFWGDVKYAGICLLPPAFFAFTFQYTGRGDRVNRRTMALLLVEPVLVLYLLNNPATHDLIRVVPAGAAAAEPGRLFWIHAIYVYLILAACAVACTASLLRISRVYWRQSVALALALAAPWFVNLLFNLEVEPFERVDLTPIAAALSGALLVWGVFRFRLLDLMPLARTSVFDAVADGCLLLDPYDRVVRVNPAAQRALDRPAAQLVGSPVTEVLPAGAVAGLAGGRPVALSLGLDDGALDHELTEAPLRDRTGRFTGRLLLLRDVTARNRAEARLRALDEQHRRLLGRIVSAQEEERARIAGDIHDDPIQALSTALLRLELLRVHTHDSEQLARIGAVEQTLAGAIDRLRNLLFDLHPPVLDEVGLAAALRDDAGAAEQPGRLTVSFEDRLGAEPPAAIRTIAYRIAQEAIANARAHAKASTLQVSLERSGDGLLLRVADDGKGFPVEEVEAGPRPGHLGLASMRERAALAGGRCDIDSTAGAGTTVSCWLPLPDL
jgi:signal transduction histidine kinase